MKHEILLCSNNGKPRYDSSQVIMECKADSQDTRITMSVHLTEWESDAYIFMPACVYDGNKFKKSYCSYPPMYAKENLGTNPAPVISDVPALNPDGSGKIEVSSGDLSVPCVGIFYRHKKQALFIFCKQECKGKNIGFCVSQGTIEIQLPAMREKCYRMCRTTEPSRDCGFASQKGEKIYADVAINELECDSVLEFLEFFFNNRKALVSDDPCESRYTDKLWSVLENHMNADNFSGEYYAEMSKKWQCGWVGGGMSSLPLLQYGSELSKSRAVKTLDFMTSNVSSKGFFHTIIENGIIKDDGFNYAHMKNAMLTRKNGDALYFLFKHFNVIKPKKQWVDAAKKCADGFVRLYENYEDFGQFVNIETGEMMFGGTTSGASVISALVLAYHFFKDEKYLKIALDAGEKYHNSFVAKGITYGGPGEAMCAPDSESCYAMVESTVLLYEATREEKWLAYAKNSLYLLSSWVMPYSFKFPVGSEFARLNINTVGSVFANVQNKHSAPGLCTSSGEAIYRLFKYTGDKKILELLRDIVLFIPQCVSTPERPMLSWDKPPRPLGYGWICERVNTSDWEGENCVGGVFAFSCWCETSLLLTFSEIIKNEEICKALKLAKTDER
ncbi:MAG: hypothetical protein IJ039_00170 [Clostridia bacterium]|nr:hypothetical protein [Clostridia bacterium]